jgi:dipeptidyl-peptidase III
MECRDPLPRAEGGSTAVAATRPYLLEQIEEAAVVQLYADGFNELPLKEKTLVWHLYQAALAGRDIYYDQRHRHNLGIRHLLEQILRFSSGVPEKTLAELTRYTKLFWLNTGPYNNLTARKFLLDLDRKRVIEAMEVAAINGAKFRLAEGESIAKHVERYARMFFDPDFEPMVTCKTPGDGQDILASSANNLYDGVTMADIEGFAEKNQLNARLAKRDGTLACTIASSRTSSVTCAPLLSSRRRRSRTR